MKKKINRILAFILIAVMLCSFAACGGNSTAPSESTPGDVSASKKDNLIIALPGEPQSLDPYAHSMYYNFMASTLVYDTLISKDAEGNYIPELATAWEFTDDNTLHIELRDDVYFHDGSKMTAEDVKFTLKTASESSFSSSIFAWYDDANTVVVDDNTLDVKLLYPYAPLMEVLATARACVIDKETYEADPARYGRSPNGTGPMKVDSWFSGDRIELVANENYWGAPLAFKTCTLRLIVEASSRTIELETGGVDIVVDLPFSDWSRIESAPNAKLVNGRTNSMSSLVFNNSIELFQDVRIRQAMAYALDLEALVQTCWEGTAEVAEGYYASNLLGFKATPYEYNPEKAKQLLAEAGYPDGFEFTFTTYQTALNQSFAEVVKNMWAQVGINVTIEIVDLATFTDMNNGGKLTVALMTPNIPIADPAPALILYPITRTISLRHNDQHIQDLLDAGVSTYDEAQRSAIYQELQDYLYSKTYTLPVAYPNFAFGAASNVEGFEFQPNQIPDLTTVTFR